MQNNFEPPKPACDLDQDSDSPRRFSWRSAFLGAAIGIAGPAYFGTLLGAVTLWIYLAQGRTIQQANALIGQSAFSLPVVSGVAAAVVFACASGWVSAAYGRGAPVLQGVATGLLAASFPVIMFLNPNNGAMPAWYALYQLGVPFLGSIAGAYACSRKAGLRNAGQ
ncbi:MAG: hypothetical protein JWN73_3370 [Betaproteobacteria bacterium]|nr:hypothetical protein [Betaproteobacteria bacterium]